VVSCRAYGSLRWRGAATYRTQACTPSVTSRANQPSLRTCRPKLFHELLEPRLPLRASPARLSAFDPDNAPAKDATSATYGRVRVQPAEPSKQILSSGSSPSMEPPFLDRLPRPGSPASCYQDFWKISRNRSVWPRAGGL
jgi:hypothetical protein